MSTIIDLMLAVRERTIIFYHKDVNLFDNYPFSEIEKAKMPEDKLLPMDELNNYRFLTYDEIDHEEIMRFYVREYVEDKAIRTQLFNILRRREYMDDYLTKLHELNLYEDFIEACEDIYIQMFEEWADRNGLDF